MTFAKLSNRKAQIIRYVCRRDRFKSNFTCRQVRKKVVGVAAIVTVAVGVAVIVGVMVGESLGDGTMRATKPSLAPPPEVGWNTFDVDGKSPDSVSSSGSFSR